MYIFTSRGYIARSGTTGSDGYYIFNLLRNCQIVFPSCTSYNPTGMYKGSNFSTFCQYLLFSVFFVKWDLTVVLMCIFLMTNDAEHFFMYSLAICISSLEKCAFNILSIFNQVVFLLLSCRSSLYIPDTNPLSDKWSATKTPLLRHHQWAYPYLVTSCKSRTWILLDELLIFCSIRKRKTISNSSSVTELQKHDNFHVMKWFTCWSSLISCEVKCTLWGFTSSIAKGLPGSTHPVMKQKRVDGVNIWANARGLGGVKKRVELYRTESSVTWLHLGEGRMCEKNQGVFGGLLNPSTGNMWKWLLSQKSMNEPVLIYKIMSKQPWIDLVTLM